MAPLAAELGRAGWTDPADAAAAEDVREGLLAAAAAAAAQVPRRGNRIPAGRPFEFRSAGTARMVWGRWQARAGGGPCGAAGGPTGEGGG